MAGFFDSGGRRRRTLGASVVTATRAATTGCGCCLARAKTVTLPGSLAGSRYAAAGLTGIGLNDALSLAFAPTGAYLGDSMSDGAYTPFPGRSSWWYWSLFVIPVLLFVLLLARKRRRR
jgi:hypothetical protein